MHRWHPFTPDILKKNMKKYLEITIEEEENKLRNSGLRVTFEIQFLSNRC